MSDSTLVFIGITFLIVAVIVSISFIIFLRHKIKAKFEKKINELEMGKNMIISSSLMTELSKAEGLANNETIKTKYKKWKNQVDEIKNKDLSKVNEKILEVDNYVQSKKYKEVYKALANAEMDLYFLKTKSDSLLEDIKNITMSEEKNRIVVTKLKAKYREILNKYNSNKSDYKEIINPIELQFENIDRLFSAFEKSIDNKEFEELSKIVKALDGLINNMHIVIEESPTILFMGKIVINKKINEVTNIYKKMLRDGYNLEYLNFDYNIKETNKKLEEILDRLNVLNLEDSIFELKTMLDYFEGLFADFEKEKLSKKTYENSIKNISNKLSRLSRIIKNIYYELGDLKVSYDLTDEEISVIDGISKDLSVIKDEFKLLNDRTLTKVNPFSNLSNDCEMLTIKLLKLEDKLDNTLRSLSSLKEDESRAREQLEEIKELLKKSKYKINDYKLPVIPKNYNVELNEAQEAIEEVVKELDKKPISIQILNTRVDTARDLVLKVYNTANETIKTAAMAEIAIVYGNRYRSNIKEIANGLAKSEKEFFKGEYKNSLEIVLNTLNIIEPGIHKKLLSAYEK